MVIRSHTETTQTRGVNLERQVLEKKFLGGMLPSQVLFFLEMSRFSFLKSYYEFVMFTSY